jgi:predicted nucleic acid-binding protein
MSAGKRFIDTNVLLYLLSGDEAKADRAESELRAEAECVLSVQVLNEFASVALRKLRMSIAETREALDPIRVVCRVEPVTEATHDLGLLVAEKYGVSLHDAMIVAAACLADCRILLSENFQDHQVFERTLEVRNPFW